jgi:tetratricopeptide (TPR) repeat protein
MKFLAVVLFTGVLFPALADDADVVCARAMDLHKSGDFAAALTQYESCLALKPQAAEIRSNYGAVLVRAGRYQDAIVQYQKALASAPGNFQLRYNLVLAYYKLGEISKAIEALTPLHEQAPENMQIGLLLADCYLRIGEMRKVIDLLSPLEAQHREEPGFAYVLGMALIRSGDVARGQALVDRILRDGNSPDAHFLLANAAFTNKDYPEAVKEFAKTVEMNPNLPTAWSFYGQSLLFTGDADGAAEAFHKELAANPNDYEANLKLGSILTVRKQYRDALPYLEHALLVRPDSAETRAELAAARKHETPVSGDAGLLATGRPAPLFSLPPVNLPELLRKGPVVLVFGSYSCPKFRFGAPALNALYDKYRDRLPFAMVYINEAHAEGDWQSTINNREGVDLLPAKTLPEKRRYAEVCTRKLTISYPVAIDGLDRKVEEAYHGWPSAVYLIGRNGRILWRSRLGEQDFHAEEMEKAILRAR